MFNLAEYETVEERISKWWKAFPDGRIETTIIDATQASFIVMALLYRTEADAKPFTTGLAHEVITSKGVNSTSALENCETSAIGRALANAGFAGNGKRASREEMEKVARVTNDATTIKIQADLSNDWESFLTDAPQSPTTLAQGVEMVSSTLAAKVLEPAPTCAHGAMARKEGISAKTNKPYGGWVCTGARNDQCEPIWDKK
jgi:hypothetical protein